MRTFEGFLWLLPILLLIRFSSTHARTCLNGGIVDIVTYSCICTSEFYGLYCETSFANSDPCSNRSVNQIVDSTGSHAPYNTQSCSVTGGCIDFSRIFSGWYRLRSPAGGSLTNTCPNTTSTCGSSSPHILMNFIQEANVNRQLYSGRLSRVARTGSACGSETEVSYPVRILGCGSFKLFYLIPTIVNSHHYCIGDKKKCSAGLVSADGSGYEPCFNASSCLPNLKPEPAAMPVLMHTKNSFNSTYINSTFQCSFTDTFATNSSHGLLYRVMYRLTFHNSTQTIVSGCTTNNLTVSPGGSATTSCPIEKLLIPNSSIYGGTLECVVQAKCNAESADYISQELISPPHRFYFPYSILDAKTNTTAAVLTSSNPVQVCLDVSKVPIIGDFDLRVNAAVPNKAIRVEIKALQRETLPSNDTLIIKIPGLQYTMVCCELKASNNSDIGVSVSTAEISASFSSTGHMGIYTAGEWVRFLSQNLMVYSTGIQTTQTTGTTPNTNSTKNTTNNMKPDPSNAVETVTPSSSSKIVVSMYCTFGLPIALLLTWLQF